MCQRTMSHQRNAAAVILWFFLMSVSGLAGLNEWTPLGPNLGTVRAIALDAQQATIIYQQTTSLYESRDAGRTFNVTRANCSGNVYYGGVIKADWRTSKMYAICNSQLSVRTFLGTNWLDIAETVYDFAVDPIDPQVVYASGFTGGFSNGSGVIYKSTDGGDTWSRILEMQGINIPQITINPQDGGVLLAADSRGNILRSVNAGSTWTTTPVSHSSFADPVLLEFDPKNPSFVLFSTGQSYSWPEFFARSFDGGVTWQPLVMPTGRYGAEWVYAVAFDPLTDGTLYAGGGGGVYRSRDWGTSWTKISSGLVPHEYPNLDPYIYVQSLAFDPNNPNRLLAGTHDGLFEIMFSTSTERVVSSGVVNAASFASPSMPNGSIARGSLFTVFDPKVADYPEQANAYPLPTSLGGEKYSMQISVGGFTAGAIMLYAGYSASSQGQINAILPSVIPAGDGVLSIIGSGRLLATHSIRVVDRSFGIFARDGTGSGVGAIHNEGAGGRLSANSLFDSAKPGQAAVLWGTGLGPVTGNEAAGPLPGNLLTHDVHVWVGGKDAALLYGGRSGCCAGLDQINFVVPDGVEGCYVPVAVQVGSIISNYVSMSISTNGGTCQLPYGLSSLQLEAARQRGSIGLGNIYVKYTGVYTPFGLAHFGRFQVNELAPYNQTHWGNFDTPPIALGSCTISNVSVKLLPPFPFVPLNAGSAIRIGSTDLPRLQSGNPSGIYWRNMQSMVVSLANITNEEGGEGANAVGHFQVSGGPQPSLFWRNPPSVVNREQGIRVTWTGGGPDELVYINGRVNTDQVYPYQFGGHGQVPQAAFSCLERASAGGFTVPPSVTMALPTTNAESAVQFELESVLTLVPFSQPARFDAIGLDAGFLTVTHTLSQTVKYE
jgi:uncharacterized protein (TIGR03437 family)